MSPALHILLVENDEVEAGIALRAIRSSPVACSVHLSRNGLEACDYLFRATSPPPSFVLLNLNLPVMGGLHVLKKIRQSEYTRTVPVIMMSSIEDKNAIRECYEMSANSFFSKAVFDPIEYESRLRLMLYYWMTVDGSCN